MEIGKVVFENNNRKFDPMRFLSSRGKQAKKLPVIDLLQIRKCELWDWIEETTGQTLSYPDPFSVMDGESIEVVQMKARGKEIIHLIGLVEKMVSGGLETEINNTKGETRC